MRPYILAMIVTTAIAAMPAAAVRIPAESAKLTQLPDDWLDKDIDERRDTQMAENETRRPRDRSPAPRPATVDCGTSSGTTGLILGAIAGGLIGNVVDGGDHRAVGTIVGAGGGALLGRKVEQNRDKCR